MVERVACGVVGAGALVGCEGGSAEVMGARASGVGGVGAGALVGGGGVSAGVIGAGTSGGGGV